MNIPIDHDYLVETLTNLVRINSINPTLVPGGAGEAEIATYTAASLARIGLEVAIHEPQRVADAIDSFMKHGPVTAATLMARLN